MENEAEKKEQSKHEGGGGGGRCLGAGKKRAKERDKQRKKLRRKRKRREEAKLREEEGKERSEQEEEECEREADAPRHDEKKKRMYGVCLNVEEICALKKEAAEAAKENISSSSCPLAKLFPDPDPSFRRPQDSAFNQPQQSSGVAEGTTDKPSEKKQHKGLRCKKCFALLLRDQDFEHRNGRLWLTNASVLGANKPGRWDGLCFQHNKVYCQNMHYVGQREAVAWTNLTRHVPVLRADKTTFHANFPHLLPPPSSATRNPSATAP